MRRRFCWRERSEKLNWRLLGALDVSDVVRQGDPAVLEPYALHITFARLPNPPKDPTTRDAWFLVRVLQLAMEYLLFMRARDGDVLESLGQELRRVEKERDELLLGVQKWKMKARSGDKQVEKLHQVLQNIAKLLQIHGASPSAVATIEALLTELIAERRAKQKKRALVEKEVEEELVQEARVCGFCGKLFSSAEYLEKHLVRRHGGENVEMETPVKSKMRQEIGSGVEKENWKKSEESSTTEAAMQKMVQQVERALSEHREKMRSFAEEEAEKIKKMYERLRIEVELAEELKIQQKADQEQEETQRQLDEIRLQKQNAEDELADLKQQIQFLSLKRKMMGAAAIASVATRSSHEGDAAVVEDAALVVAEEEITNLQQTLESVNAELTASREELAKVQALHLSALRKKKELADKLAMARYISTVETQENGSQTEQVVMVHEDMQTDEQSKPLHIESEMLTESHVPHFEDMGTDPLNVSYEDVGIQTLNVHIPSVDAEVQVAILDELVFALAPVTSPVASEPVLQDSSTAPTGTAIEEAVSPEPIAEKDDEHFPNYIQQVHIQDILNIISERAQSAASKVQASDLPVSRDYSSISRHKYVRSRFQHDEGVIKERITSCLAQLEQFSRRFGVPAKSVWLSEGNLHIVQQALHGHLEVLPHDVLAKMVECENAVNAMIEKEWMPMEKSRQQALERFKMEIHARSQISQGLVRQAMAAFGAPMKTDHVGDATSSEVMIATNAEKTPATGESSVERTLSENRVQHVPTDIKDDSAIVSARRYSVNNQLTVDVGRNAVTDGTTTGGTEYRLADNLEERIASSPSKDFELATTELEEKASPREVLETVDYLTENLRHGDKALDLEANLAKPSLMLDDTSHLQSRHDIFAAHPVDDPQEIVASAAREDKEHLEITESRFPKGSPQSQIKTIKVDAAMDDNKKSSWGMDSLARNHSRELLAQEPASIESQKVGPAQENIEDNGNWQDEKEASWEADAFVRGQEQTSIEIQAAVPAQDVEDNGDWQDVKQPSWEVDSLARRHSRELPAQNPALIEIKEVVFPQENTEDNDNWQNEEREEHSPWNLLQVGSSPGLDSATTRTSVNAVLSRTTSGDSESASVPKPTDSLQSDRLSAASEFADIESVTALDRTQSIVASTEMSFDTSVASLGESDSMEASPNTVATGFMSAIGKRDEGYEESASSFDCAPEPTPAPTAAQHVRSDNVMSFDDSDIEEVVLT